MRICLYTESALPMLGGQEHVVDSLAREFNQAGHPTMVLAPTPRSPHSTRDDKSLPYPVVRHPRFVSTHHFVAWYRRWLLRAQRDFRFDVLHCHSVYPTGYLANLTRAELGVPVVITSHGGDVEQDNHRLQKPGVLERHQQAIAAADALVSISRFTTEGFLRLCPHASNIVDIPNGVDLEPFAEQVARPANFDPAIEPGQYLLFLGRLDERKGVDLIVKALAQMPIRGGVEVVFAGTGKMQAELQQLAESCGVAHRIRFVGRAAGATKHYLLQNCMATVMPSRWWEAFPLVVLESYAAGRPVVATKIPGLENLVEPGHTGWLIPPDSVEDLANQLTEVVAEPNVAAKLGDNARNLAQDFAWSTIARRHLTLFENLLANRAKRSA